MKTFSELQESLGSILKKKQEKSKSKLKEDDKDPCWKGYQQVGMKKKNGKEVPNCVPKEEVEEGKLPPHLSKFFDKKGNLNKDAEERVKQGRKKRGLDQYTGKKLKSVKEQKKYEIKNGKIYISKADFSKVHNDYKNSTRGKERMSALDPKSGATKSYQVVFTESTSSLNRFETITEGKQESAAIRKILKDKYKLTSRDVGVVNKYGGYSSSVTLTIKTEKALALKDKLDNLSNEFQKYERDYATQEILLGGNTYVFVQMDRKLSKSLEDKIVAQVEKIMKDDPSTDGFDLFKTFHVHFEGKTTYVSGIKGGTSVSAHDKSPFTIANLVLHYISRNGNPSMYAKIK